MLSPAPDGLSGAPPLRDRPALQLSYLSTPDRGAGQVRAALYSITTGKLILVTNWIYGKAFDFNTPAGSYLLNNGQFLSPSGASMLTFTVYQHGTYRVQLQFAWERSSSGAPAGSSAWFWDGVPAASRQVSRLRQRCLVFRKLGAQHS